MTTKMTRSELQHALACEDVSEGLREVIDDLWQLDRVERGLCGECWEKANRAEATETRLGAGDTAYVMAWCAWRKAEREARADFDEGAARQRFVRWWDATGDRQLEQYGYHLLDTSNAR